MTSYHDDDDRWADAVGRDLRAGTYSRPAARAAIMAAVASERSTRGFWQRTVRWALTPRTVQLSPVAGAMFVLVGLAAVLLLRPADPAVTTPSVTAGARVMRAAAPGTLTHFALLAPDAHSVSLVGDFNDWDPRATPLRRADGAWEVDLTVAAGRHTYAFIVDGADWVPDPSAPMEQGADFGRGNSLLLVRRS